MRHWLTIGLLCLFQLSGCSLTPEQGIIDTSVQPLSPHQRSITTLTEWQLQGRIIITLNDESWHATLRWDQHQENFDISLTAPFGQGSIRLTGAQGRTTLESSDGGFSSAADPESLLFEQFGVEVPLSALRYWIVGLPTPGYHRQQLDEQGHMIALEQHNWQIRINRYRPYGNLQLPGRLFLNGDQGEVRLAITHWTFNSMESLHEPI